MEPEPDFLAGAGAEAGEKAPAQGCCCLAQGYCGGKVVTILVKFSHISTIYTQIERKIGTYTLKKTKLLTSVFKTALVLQNCCYPEPGAGAGTRAGQGQPGSTTLMGTQKTLLSEGTGDVIV